jgi:hypothetical protein
MGLPASDVLLACGGGTGIVFFKWELNVPPAQLDRRVEKPVSAPARRATQLADAERRRTVVKSGPEGT